MTKQTGNTTLLILVVAVIAIGVGLILRSMQQQAPRPPEFKSTILLPQAKPIELAEMLDHRQEPVDLSRFKGKWSLLFFGFTHCPDICPTTLQTLAQAKRQLVEQGMWSNFQVFMITVDPERDTPEQLANYVPYFDPEFNGVISPIEQLEEFAKQMGILFVKRETNQQGGYEVDHSAAIILLNPKGEYAGVITAPHRADDIAQDLAQLAEYKKLPRVNPASESTKSANALDNEADSQRLRIDNAWIRAAPPGSKAMAGYFTLQNNSSQPLEIIAVTSPLFANAMIHQTRIDEQGVAQMNHLPRLVIPAQQKVSLQPMGTHVMLMMPKQELTVGQMVELELIDANQTKHRFELEVRVTN